MPGYGAVRAPVAVERAVARPSVSLELLPESANSTEEIRPSPAGFASAAVASSAIAVKAPPIASDFPPGFVRLKLTFERSAESVWARAEEGTRAPRRTSSAAFRKRRVVIVRLPSEARRARRASRRARKVTPSRRWPPKLRARRRARPGRAWRGRRGRGRERDPSRGGASWRSRAARPNSRCVDRRSRRPARTAAQRAAGAPRQERRPPGARGGGM